jgi:hypothetical protein
MAGFPVWPAVAGADGKLLSAATADTKNAAAVSATKDISASRFILLPQESYSTCRQAKNQFQKGNRGTF